VSDAVFDSAIDLSPARDIIRSVSTITGIHDAEEKALLASLDRAAAELDAGIGIPVERD
jgi:hypothetical protein